MEGGVEFKSIARERLQDKEETRDQKGSWAIYGKERRPGVERVETLKE